MTSSTSLYTTSNAANTSGGNYTTLYSGGAGVTVPQRAYGNANVVSLLAAGTDGGNTIAGIVATGNVTTTGNISATGNIYTAGWFVGNIQGDITGNIAAAGSNTQIQFNNNNSLGASGNLTFNNSTNVLSVTGNVNSTTVNATTVNSGTVTAAGNVVTSGTGLLVGNVFTEVAAGANTAVITARMATDDTFRIMVGGTADNGFVEIASADSATEPIYVRQYTGGGGGPFTTLARSLTLLDAAGNTDIPGNVSVVGNVAAAYFIGNGSALTSITAANITGTVGLAQYVTANAQANITSVGILTALSASGNITSGNVNSLANISAVGNIAASYYIGNGSQLTGVAAVSAGANTWVQFNDSGVTSGSAGFTFNKTSNAVAVSGNITGANINGNGSGLSSITGANVTGTVANATYALNANAATYAVDAVQSNYANIANSVAGANVTGTVSTANTVTDAAQANITSVGILTSLSVSGNITSGNITNNGTITSVGNITAPNFIGNIAGNVVAGGANTQVQFNDNNLLNGTAGFTFDKTSNALAVTGNVSGGNVIVPINGRYYGDFTTGSASGRTMFQTTGTGTTAATSLAAIPGANHIVSNTAFSSQMQLFADSANIGNSSFGRMIQYGNRLEFNTSAAGAGVAGNMRFSAGAAQMVFLTTGNVGIGNADPQHTLSVQGTAYIGTDLSVIGNISPVNSISASGNITGANLVASANLTSTQQTIVGTANNGSTGNIVMSGKNIATDMLLSPDGGNATTAQRGRVLIGTGFDGNNAHNVIHHRLYVNDSITRSATANNAMQLFASDTQVSLTGNVTGSSFRQQAVAARLRIGGGSAANTINLTLTNASIFSVAALQPNIDVGNAATYLLGNTSVGQAVLNGGFITPAPGSTVTHAYGMIPAVNNATGGIVTNYIGFASQLGLMSGSVTGNVYGMYHGSNATLSTTGIATANAARSAPGYYAFYNADDVAQVKLGSLRAYHEFQFTANTSSTVNIDKNNGQIQYIGLTGNATIGDFQNFVTTASNSVSNINQIDTVTLIIKQGATPYTVTMPTGNVAIKYAGNIQTIGTTANSASMVSITAANVGGSALYMVTIAPEFQ